MDSVKFLLGTAPAGQKWPAPKAIVAPPTTSSLTVAEAAILAEATAVVNLFSVDTPAPSSPVMVDGKLFTKWNTMGSLAPASSGAPLAETPTGNAPYWSVSPWTDCSAQCGGGMQVIKTLQILADRRTTRRARFNNVTTRGKCVSCAFLLLSIRIFSVLESTNKQGREPSTALAPSGSSLPSSVAFSSNFRLI